MLRPKRIKSVEEGRNEYAGVKGPDCSEGFTFIDSADLLDCPVSRSCQTELGLLSFLQVFLIASS